MHNFSLLILSAGFGSRMKNLTYNLPKPLLKVNNKCLLENTICFFRDIGCNEILINTHYLYNKIEKYIRNNSYEIPLSVIYEPTILGTGGAVKNIFNYTNSNKILVVNSDIFWQKENKLDILNFLKDFNDIEYCKILLSHKDNFFGLKNKNGDFNIYNSKISKHIEGEEILYYSGLQILSSNIFKKTKHIFSINGIWNELINTQKLKGQIIHSKILHIGDKQAYEDY